MVMSFERTGSSNSLATTISGILCPVLPIRDVNSWGVSKKWIKRLEERVK